MKITRRTFLGVAPLAGGALVLLNKSVLGQLNQSELGQNAQRDPLPVYSGDTLAKFSWDSFYPFIYTDFTFGEGYNAVPLTLVDMTDSRPFVRARKTSQENFVMKFRGPRDRVLTTGTYRVNHFSLGDFDLFITDGGRVSRQQYYVAVINRVLQ
jgi:hypothetical protein